MNIVAPAKIEKKAVKSVVRGTFTFILKHPAGRWLVIDSSCTLKMVSWLTQDELDAQYND